MHFCICEVTLSHSEFPSTMLQYVFNEFVNLIIRTKYISLVVDRPVDIHIPVAIKCDNTSSS